MLPTSPNWKKYKGSTTLQAVQSHSKHIYLGYLPGEQALSFTNLPQSHIIGLIADTEQTCLNWLYTFELFLLDKIAGQT